jgi:hypothetical protein
MSLSHQVDPYDYAEAIKKVEKLLDNIEADQEREGSPYILRNMPSAVGIVDMVIDIII